jgi:hypothetical protein
MYNAFMLFVFFPLSLFALAFFFASDRDENFSLTMPFECTTKHILEMRMKDMNMRVFYEREKSRCMEKISSAIKSTT